MKYRYRNRKTGEVITTTNRIGGKNWEPIEEDPVLPPEDDFEDNPVAEEEPETVKEPAESPVEKPTAKSSRKGKK